MVDKLLDLSAFVILGASVLGLSTGAMALVQFFALKSSGFCRYRWGWGDFTFMVYIARGIARCRYSGVCFPFPHHEWGACAETDLFYGAFLGSVASGIVRYAGTAAVGPQADNPLLFCLLLLLSPCICVGESYCSYHSYLRCVCCESSRTARYEACIF